MLSLISQKLRSLSMVVKNGLSLSPAKCGMQNCLGIKQNSTSPEDSTVKIPKPKNLEEFFAREQLFYVAPYDSMYCNSIGTLIYYRGTKPSFHAVTKNYGV